MRCSTRVGPRLQREVDVLAHRRRLGHRLDHVGGEVVRMRAREPDPADARRRPPTWRSRSANRGSARRSGHGHVAAVGVHVLSEQGDLDDAARGEPLHLGEHVADRLASAAALARAARCRRCRRCRTRARSRPTRGTRRGARPAARSGTSRCTRARPSAGPRPRDRSSRSSRCGQGVRADDDVDPWRLPLDQPWSFCARHRSRRCAGRGFASFSRLQVARGCRTACCRRSRGSRRC